MMTDRLLRLMTSLPIDVVRSAWIGRARAEADRTAEAREWLRGYGFAEITDDDAATALRSWPDEYLPDGRVVLRAQGRVWAMAAEAWAQRRTQALEQAKQRAVAMVAQPPQQSPPTTTCTGLIDGQLCGGTLIRAAVCPRCALGKSGVAATLTCDVCGHVSAIMRGDS